ncbi:MAG: hypothetical protein R3350_02690, partial [Saprospiraceae bacterium]|nr:hypothetical protein [Saprospiraceae bacterium]
MKLIPDYNLIFDSLRTSIISIYGSRPATGAARAALIVLLSAWCFPDRAFANTGPGAGPEIDRHSVHHTRIELAESGQTLSLGALSWSGVEIYPEASSANRGVTANGNATFGKAFAPATIAPGSVSTLTFTITNTGSVPLGDLAFTDVLPVGVTIASVPGISNQCAGSVTAPAGGSTISLSGGSLGSFSECTISVNVTSSTIGTHMNVSGNLTSTAGNAGPATADLTVSDNRPTFSKTFSPSTILVEQKSRLTFNLANPTTGNIFSISFADQLPAGLQIAPLPNLTTDCTAFIIADAGTTTVSFLGGSLSANASCTLSVDVVASSAAGPRENVTTDLTSTKGSSGKAAALLTVQRPTLVKLFTDDPVAPGGTVNLDFTITNFSRGEALTGIAFTDDLAATLSGLMATGLPLNDVCGAGSQLSGTSLITLTGGNLPAEGTCTFSVTLQVPAGAMPGSYINTTSSVTGDRGGSPFTGNAATDILDVLPIPRLEKEFTDDPVLAGGTATLEFTITNTSTDFNATNINFEDELTNTLPV